ncbi:MAG: hypothetical protein H5T78_03505 [Nocardia sp.]|nr:hypothetical protein [Nocardia sp.]
MDFRSRDNADMFPLVDGDPVDTGTRLRAELHFRRTAAVLTVHGQIDAYTRNRWRRVLDTALVQAEETGRLVIDLDDAQFIGCRPALDLAQRAERGTVRGVRVSVVDPAPSVLDRIITITGLGEWLPVLTEPTEILTDNAPRTRVCAPVERTVLTPRSS